MLFTVWKINSESSIHARCCTEPAWMCAYSKHIREIVDDCQRFLWGWHAINRRLPCVWWKAETKSVWLQVSKRSSGRAPYYYYTASPRSLEAMRQTFIWGDTDNGPGLFPLLRLPISLNCCTHRRMLSGRGFALNCSEIPLNTPFLPPTTHTQPSGARTPFLEQRPWPPRYLRRRSVWRMRICMHARYI